MVFAAMDTKAVDRLAQDLTPAERDAVHTLIVELNELLKRKGILDAQIAANNAYIAEAKEKGRQQVRDLRDSAITTALIGAPILIPTALLALTVPGVKGRAVKFIKEKLEDKIGLEVTRFALGEKEAKILERSLDFIGYLGIKTGTLVGKFNFVAMIVGELLRSSEANPQDDLQQIASQLDEQIAAKLSVLVAILDRGDPYLASAYRALGYRSSAPAMGAAR